MSDLLARLPLRAHVRPTLSAALVAALVAGAGTGVAVGATTDAAPAALEASDLIDPREDEARVGEPVRDLRDWGLDVRTNGHVLVPVWFVAGERDRLRLAPEAIDATAMLGGTLAVSRTELARVAMELVLTSLPSDPLKATGAPEGAHVLGVELDGDVLIVDVSAGLAAVSGTRVREEALAQQLAHTAWDTVGARAIRLRVEGRDVTRLWGHVDWARPVTVDGISPAEVAHDGECDPGLAANA